MSKRLAGFYGQKCISNNCSPQANPKEYTVLGVNQPLIAPNSEQLAAPKAQPFALSVGGKPRKFWLSLLSKGEEIR